MQLAKPEIIRISRELNGAIKIEIGGFGCVMAPPDAIRFAASILKTSGCNVDFANGPLAPQGKPS